MTQNIHAPSVNETAFNCPHCGAFTSQTWYKLYADRLTGENKIPLFPDAEAKERVRDDPDFEPDFKEKLLDYIQKMESGLPFLEKHQKNELLNSEACNLVISRCYNCDEIAVWVHDKLIFPPELGGPQPNWDLPDTIKADYEEARSILNLSPRGSAALLRLAIQKLCISLGEKGKNIDDDIASLVKKGLNPLVQKSLDVVRVIGNEAVHPGTLDLKDDRDTAARLFGLINVIADQMISHPKVINEMYQQLPPAKREAIEKRDQKAKPE